METIRILNAEIQNITALELLDGLKRGVLVTPNVNQLVKLQRDREFCKNGLNAENMAKRLSALMDDEKKRDSMALAAIKKSKNYSIEEIYRRWIEVITNLVMLKK